jgi:hypothetical protein
MVAGVYAELHDACATGPAIAVGETPADAMESEAKIATVSGDVRRRI